MGCLKESAEQVHIVKVCIEVLLCDFELFQLPSGVIVSGHLSELESLLEEILRANLNFVKFLFGHAFVFHKVILQFHCLFKVFLVEIPAELGYLVLEFLLLTTELGLFLLFNFVCLYLDLLLLILLDSLKDAHLVDEVCLTGRATYRLHSQSMRLDE